MTHFFTEKLRDFSLMKEDTVRALQEVTEFFERCNRNEQALEMVDPSSQYLEECREIGTPRYLRSVAELKSVEY